MTFRFSKTSIGRLRLTGITEGISYLLLLGIAMPLKYFADMPEAVKYVGWIHGLLFVFYCVILLEVWIKLRWSFGRIFVAFAASLLPFGTFIADARLRKDELALQG